MRRWRALRDWDTMPFGRFDTHCEPGGTTRIGNLWTFLIKTPTAALQGSAGHVLSSVCRASTRQGESSLLVGCERHIMDAIDTVLHVPSFLPETIAKVCQDDISC